MIIMVIQDSKIPFYTGSQTQKKLGYCENRKVALFRKLAVNGNRKGLLIYMKSKLQI